MIENNDSKRLLSAVPAALGQTDASGAPLDSLALSECGREIFYPFNRFAGNVSAAQHFCSLLRPATSSAWATETTR